ncbi:hypothetical protein BVRB_5g101300 [Beta vulgaris subsp. vulgaris]|nr:hypothetical protein BVRB_5g101300 [Beta vulgaris subsp. vulgaris]
MPLDCCCIFSSGCNGYCCFLDLPGQLVKEAFLMVCL